MTSDRVTRGVRLDPLRISATALVTAGATVLAVAVIAVAVPVSWWLYHRPGRPSKPRRP